MIISRFKPVVLGLPTLIMSLMLVATPVAVYAHDGASDTQQTTTNTTTVETENHTEQAPETEAVREAAKQKTEHAQELGRQENEQHKKTKKSAEELQKKCEDRKHGLTNKVGNINTNAQKHLDHITMVYEKALQYSTEHTINPDGFADLTAQADDAKVQAQASVDALKQLKPTLDCASGTVAADVATFKAAVEQARKDLRAYRSSVKDILKALEEAKEGSEQ